MLRTWLDRGVTVQQAYGMTESAPAGTVLDSADAVAKVGSAGKQQFFVDVRVVRPDGTECDPDEVGEVVLSGANVMAGYWEAPESTAEVIRDGWYHSGDAGSVDEDGYLYIRDRYKDMIISGGENVYPAEVESALRELPQVGEAAVIGVPHEHWGEVGLAVLVPAPGFDPATDPAGDGIRTALRDRLAGFKVPKEVRWAAELPKTATARSASPTYDTCTCSPRRTHDHHRHHRRDARAQGHRARHQRLVRDHPGGGEHLRRRHRGPPVDPRRRRARQGREPFGGPIAHGFMTLSLAVPLATATYTISDAVMGVNYGLNKVRFPAPVPVGSRVRATTTLKDVEEVAGGVQNTIAVVIEREGGDKPVCIAEWVTRAYGKPAG